MNATETRIVTKRLRERPADSWMLAAVKETGGYAEMVDDEPREAGIREDRFFVREDVLREADEDPATDRTCEDHDAQAES